MGRVLLIIDHIAHCTPCIALLLVSHTCVFCDRPHGAGTRGVNGAEIGNSSGASAKERPSCMDTNLAIGSRKGPVQQTTPSLSFVHLYILIMILAYALSL
jgi:hypothetical protein